MEMRRIASKPFGVERLIITAYWLIAGYGLRAWRSLTVLAALFAGSALVLMKFSLRSTDTDPPGFGDALLFAVQSGLSLPGASNLYSESAQIVQIVLRVLVPPLIALAILSLRARVKR
jgi:hypothetical protein